jgi:hypothetical protein
MKEGRCHEFFSERLASDFMALRRNLHLAKTHDILKEELEKTGKSMYITWEMYTCFQAHFITKK